MLNQKMQAAVSSTELNYQHDVMVLLQHFSAHLHAMLSDFYTALTGTKSTLVTH